MTQDTGSQELARIATAYLASIAFGATFLIATLTGTDGATALIRSVIAVIAACVVGRLLLGPAINAVLTAMARDEAERRAALRAAEDEEDDR
ncbi:MAG: hypothetical protein KDE27_20115 [Planctomycetes bacterium]|nr:hypothetical protein [Planctomycetota bacterium]